MAKDREMEYGILMGVTVAATLAAVGTLIPVNKEKQKSFLGYRALCSWSPVSTALCLVAAGAACIARAQALNGAAEAGAGSDGGG